MDGAHATAAAAAATARHGSRAKQQKQREHTSRTGMLNFIFTCASLLVNQAPAHSLSPAHRAIAAHVIFCVGSLAYRVPSMLGSFMVLSQDSLDDACHQSSPWCCCITEHWDECLTLLFMGTHPQYRCIGDLFLPQQAFNGYRFLQLVNIATMDTSALRLFLFWKKANFAVQ
eukprot:1142711-Pelagomonas_calceolata.AAC.4